jgi:hypothetical protein
VDVVDLDPEDPSSPSQEVQAHREVADEAGSSEDAPSPIRIGR